MPQTQLTDREVKSKAKTPGVHRVATGLYLRVRLSGAAYWILRFSKDEKAHEMSLGPYGDLTLAEALGQASALRLDLRRERIDPIEARRIARRRDAGARFRDVAQQVIDGKRHAWRSEKHAKQWLATLETFAYPTIGDKDVADIDTADILAVLRPVWSDRHETATRLRQRLENVLSAATALGLREGANPARWKGHLDKLLVGIPKSQRVVHHPALPWKEVPAFMVELGESKYISARALAFLILTATRTGDVIGARWEELDLEAGIWTVPGSRHKSKGPFRVALSKQAIGLLKALPRLEGEPWMFPGARKGRPLSNMAMLEMLKGMRPGQTVHGLRSSFRDWAGEATSFGREIAEHAMAHVVGNATETAYRRGDALERRRELMEAWAQYLSPPKESKVVPIKSKKTAGGSRD